MPSRRACTSRRELVHSSGRRGPDGGGQPITHLYRVVVGDGPSVLEAADRLQRRRVRAGLPGGTRIHRAAREAGIVAREKPSHHALRVEERARVGQSEFRDEAVLEGAKEPFNAAFGLGRVSCYPPNAEFCQSAANLRGVALALELLRERGLRRRAKDAVAIRVDRPRDAIAAQHLAEEQEVPVRVLFEPEDGPEHTSGRIVNGGEEDQAWSALLQPRTTASIHLDEAGLRHPLATSPVARWASGPRTPEAGRPEQALDRPAREAQAVASHEHLRQVMIVEARIRRAGEREHPVADSLREASRGGLTAVPMDERREAQPAQPGQEPTQMPQRKTQELGRRRGTKPAMLHLGEHMHAMLFPLAHDDHLPGHGPG